MSVLSGSRSDEPALRDAAVGFRPFDAPAAEFRLAAEAQRITMAGSFDPMLALETSKVAPLPHQIDAVYHELVPCEPLRFLLADDAGTGKTIVAGLYIKELLLRDRVTRCLVVTPGGRVQQWQDELADTFGLHFDILPSRPTDAANGPSVFDTRPLVIAGMDRLARNDELLAQLGRSQWDLVVVDEAHRMGARYVAGRPEKSRRFLFGERLSTAARRLLLLTATPPAGKEEDVQLFLTLLDRDRFEGRYRKGVHDLDTSGLMRRTAKEDLLTFEGQALFPERIAQTVPYELAEAEHDLYEGVTRYVREGMDRAASLDGQRRNSVELALTVLQRRLASSPQAIYGTLVRRSERLARGTEEVLKEGRCLDAETPEVDVLADPEEYSAEQIEQAEEQLVNGATAAGTAEELDAELTELAELTRAASAARDSGTNGKWVALRTILEGDIRLTQATGIPPKVVVVTEHRDTLDYLTTRIGCLLGEPDAVAGIHAGLSRQQRRQIAQEFTKNAGCQVLLATDAAGADLDLRAAHLMVNYDLPWDPNRIERRFGWIHRIGQMHVCRLWNLVASNTLEGEVFTRLLECMEEQRSARGGEVFDVLGSAFQQTPLRQLLVEVIRCGEQHDVPARIRQLVDDKVTEGMRQLMQWRARTCDQLADADVAALRRALAEAAHRRVQPHYVEGAFRAAFTRLGGHLAEREPGRFEITDVPAPLRGRDGRIATRYERVTFDLGHHDVDTAVRADVLAPQHPLHDAVMQESIAQGGASLQRGAVLVSPNVDEPQLLIGVVAEVVDATGVLVARRFGYLYVDQQVTVTPAGPAPHLDCLAAPDGPASDAARGLPWLADAEAAAVGYLTASQLPAFLDEVARSRSVELAHTRKQVSSRLRAEYKRLLTASRAARESKLHGGHPKESSDRLARKAADLKERLRRRRVELDQQARMSTLAPRVVAAAVVVPLSHVQDQVPKDAPVHAMETTSVERRGIDLVRARERALGRWPAEQLFTTPGYDIFSETPNGDPLRIEVKARLAGAEDFFVTHNEVMLAKNAVPHYRLALVRVDPTRPENDQVRYLDDPFATTELDNFDAMGIRCDWGRFWAKGRKPF